MTALTDLCQEVILDHNKSPQNFRALEGATHSGIGHNPLCGDQLTLYVIADGGSDAKVELVWDPPWNPGMMSKMARAMLGM
jgi:nitrogen fixation protein NifU and related proteins